MAIKSYLRLIITVFIFSAFIFFNQNTHAGNSEPPGDFCQQQPEKGGQFAQCPPFRLDVVLGEGCMLATAPGINCGDDCFESYSAATVVTINVMPEPGFEFAGWSQQCTGDLPSLTIAVNSNILCQANCQPTEEDQEIEISVDGGVDSEGDMNEDTEIVVAPNNEGETFENVNVVINFPDGVIVNSATLGENDGNADPVVKGIPTIKEDGLEGCDILSDTQIDCLIKELSEETSINLNLFIPNLGETLQAVAMVTTDTVPGQTLQQILTIIAGRADEGGSGGSSSGGCTIAATSGSKTAILIFALIPVAVLIRRLREK